MYYMKTDLNSIPTASRVSIKRRWIIGILLTAILATMMTIFLLSAESRIESGDRSRGVTMLIARILYPDFDDMPYGEQMQIVNGMHRTVRKGAHFSEYALLGGLVVTALYVAFSSRVRSWYHRAGFMTLAALFGLAYAASDELHQKFVQRGASVRDVFIDFVGVLFGIALATGISCLVTRNRARKNTSKGGWAS